VPVAVDFAEVGGLDWIEGTECFPGAGRNPVRKGRWLE